MAATSYRKPPTNAEDAAVRKLEQLVDDLRQRHEWNEDEVAIIDSMIKMWRGFQAIALIGGSFKQILIWVGVFTAAVVAFRAGALSWLGLK